jgi:hypothetical protein
VTDKAANAALNARLFIPVYPLPAFGQGISAPYYCNGFRLVKLDCGDMLMVC